MLFDGFFHITQTAAFKFLRRHHYQGSCARGCVHVGAFLGGELVGVVSFGQPSSAAVVAGITSLHHSHVIELVRLALNTREITATQLISEGIKLLKTHRTQRENPPVFLLVSYADTRQGHHGGVYQAASWLYTGLSKGSGSMYIDEAGEVRQRRSNGKNINIDEARALGWGVIKCSDKHRYIKPIGTPKQRRRALKSLRVEILNYSTVNGAQ